MWTAIADVFRPIAPVLAASFATALLSFVFSPARSLALLVLSQLSTIVSLGLFSREAGSLSPTAIGLALAALVLPVLPDHVSTPVSLAASLTVGVLAFVLLVRHPRQPLGPVAGQLAVVTGCSSGIGLEIATQLLGAGMSVVFACRNEGRASAAMRRALDAAAAPAERAIFIPLDLSSCASVVACAKRVQTEAARHESRCRAAGAPAARAAASSTDAPPLHALVCNAGGFSAAREETLDGFEMNFGANFLAHALLTKLLLPSVHAAGGRIVNVSSSMHKNAPTASLVTDPMSKREYGVFSAYARQHSTRGHMPPTALAICGPF